MHLGHLNFSRPGQTTWVTHLKIVQLVYEYPQPHGPGGDLRNLSINAALSRLGAVTIVSARNALPRELPRLRRKKSRIEAAFAPETIASLVAQVEASAPDLIVIEGVLLSDIMLRLIDRGHRVILDMHNVESALQRQTDCMKRGMLAPLRYRKRWRAAFAADRHLAAAAQRVWVCSEDDAALLRQLCQAELPIDVVPNPIPPWCHGVGSLAARPTTPHALYVGHLSYPPNVAAVHRLLERIMPALTREVPDMHLHLCGHTPSARVREISQNRSDVTLTANPAQIAPHYQRAAFTMIPLNAGGGTRLKVLEALAMGLPMIATTKAVEGIAVENEKTFLQAESDADFVMAARRLISEPELCAALASAGRRFVYDNYGPDVIDAAIAQAVTSLPAAHQIERQAG